MNVAYVFTIVGQTIRYILGGMILRQLEEDRHGAPRGSSRDRVRFASGDGSGHSGERLRCSIEVDVPRITLFLPLPPEFDVAGWKKISGRQ
jgi:hypothetical protein